MSQPHMTTDMQINEHPELVGQRLLEGALTTPAGCWEWVKSTVRGYGQINIGGKMMSVHRVAYKVWRGPIANGMDVCHRCDNPRCLNPDHLFLGTAADNLQDAARKGRMTRGSRQWAAKLTEADVTAIKRLLACGTQQKALAAQYGVNKATISNIANGKAWKHAPKR